MAVRYVLGRQGRGMGARAHACDGRPARGSLHGQDGRATHVRDARATVTEPFLATCWGLERLAESAENGPEEAVDNGGGCAILS